MTSEGSMGEIIPIILKIVLKRLAIIKFFEVYLWM